MFLLRLLLIIIGAGCLYYDYLLWPWAKMLNQPISWGWFAFVGIAGLLFIQQALKKK